VSQWADELVDRAPCLRVLIYPGLQALPDNFECETLLDYDVILTTYPVLAKELHYATPAPDRSMRYQKARPVRRSPLMQYEWWRVCLDEAQMVEGSVTKAATVARLIPRIVRLLLTP
jgi:E3 ubiquitin-protein ligase SHPRH